MRRRGLALALLLAGAASAQPAVPALSEARARAEAGDYDGARALLERRLAAAPGDADARFLLARVQAWSGRPALALPIYRELLAAEPRNADYLLGYGQALLWSGDAPAAVEALERARAAAPGYPAVDEALAAARAARASGAVAADGVDAAGAPAARPAATAPAPSPLARRLALSARRDRLDRGLRDWTGLRLDGAWIPAGRSGLYGALVSERRFGLRDDGVEVGAVLPLGGGWTLQPEVGVVPDAGFLPSSYVDLRLQRDLGGGWLASASARRSDYRDVDVQRLALGVERYAGAWRMGYVLGLTRLAGRHATGHDLRLARAYGERSEVGLQLAAGREAALLGPTVVASDVRAAALFGRHAIGDWALLWNLGRVEQGGLYTRDGLGLGLERRF